MNFGMECQIFFISFVDVIELNHFCSQKLSYLANRPQRLKSSLVKFTVFYGNHPNLSLFLTILSLTPADLDCVEDF